MKSECVSERNEEEKRDRRERRRTLLRFLIAKHFSLLSFPFLIYYSSMSCLLSL